jgi:glycosyltransferase involved in cell wall biosynthesis
MPPADPPPPPSGPPLVLTVFATFAVGGPQVRFAAVANRLGPALRHAVVAMDGDLACRARLDPALDVSFPDFAPRKGDLPGTLRLIRHTLRALRPRTLLTHNWGSIEWALAQAPPLPAPFAPRPRHVHVEDGFGPEERDRQMRRRVWLRRLALRRATVVMPSRTLMGLADAVWRLDPARLRHVPNGIDLGRFAPAAPSWTPPPWTPPPGLPAGRPVVGTVAALRPEKNLPRLLDALALLPDAGLLIVGDGPERPALEALARRPGLAGRVVFAGHMADPAAAYRHMDVFALSSDTEQMPLSVLEAMAAGLPVAATDVGDVAALVAAPNRPFVVPRDAAALAAALGRLLADAPTRHAAGAANRARAERDYDQETMFAAWGGLLGAG